ncbi:uncharacterized protein BDZ99DRAFT_516812 [Mytilinidion resinicola]|uniref:Uncharacterized protein n=1 Tax=Mytilinidion resinicola TaxID=574789 RepID=A0A6A6Z1Z1_9PEZI|nr:uncharacterized protein BDZ99DRAFT_516812 [Mytilinidion resinicola]KAF2814205.1 hypothetical protein BDZ99DRAFT_516812 [Mytilinidion resinicola]
MSAFRQPVRLGSSFLRPFLRNSPRTTFQPSYNRFASGDYGSGEGSPVGENPQDQGKSQLSRDLEHPGAKAPDTSSSKGQESQQSKPSSSSPGTRDKKQGKGPQPKIHSESPPDAESEDVKKHNDEMARRHDKPNEQIKEETSDDDKVDRGFWSGAGGRSQ